MLTAKIGKQKKAQKVIPTLTLAFSWDTFENIVEANRIQVKSLIFPGRGKEVRVWDW